MTTGNYLKSNENVLITEKRRSKNQPALKVKGTAVTQHSLVDLITASTISKFTGYPFQIPEIDFQNARKMK